MNELKVNPKIRILHCLTGAAGQPYINSRAQRQLGYKSDCVIATESKFGYNADYRIIEKDKKKKERLQAFSTFIKQNVDHYDVFHFYARPFFLTQGENLSSPSYLDLLALKAARKTIIYNFRGSEVRSASKFKNFTEFNYVDENPSGIFTKYSEQKIKNSTSFVSAVADKILVPDPELQSYVPNSEIVERSINISEWECNSNANNKIPIVLHAPSRREIKGTQFILNAVNSLKSRGVKFEFRLVENIPNSEAQLLYQKADIIVDQLRIGWYGVLAVECMALGKPVISYIRSDLEHNLPNPCPIVNANPLNIEHALHELIKDKTLRTNIGINARKYCERHHDAKVINNELIAKYNEAIENDREINIEKVLDFITTQSLLNKVKPKVNLLRRLRLFAENQ